MFKVKVSPRFCCWRFGLSPGAPLGPGCCQNVARGRGETLAKSQQIRRLGDPIRGPFPEEGPLEEGLLEEGLLEEGLLEEGLLEEGLLSLGAVSRTNRPRYVQSVSEILLLAVWVVSRGAIGARMLPERGPRPW